MSSFLIIKPIALEYQLLNPYEVPYGYIYCVENKLNQKKYIGSTHSNWNDIQKPDPINILRKRASQYIYEYNSGIERSESTRKLLRPIIRAMVEDGIENFMFYPLAETQEYTHIKAENYFIDKLDTITNGYNARAKGVWGNSIGRTLTIQDKILRSDKVLAINLNQKKLVFADSMKLLGDFLGTSKDIIKNNNRSGRSHMGWFIFYINREKRFYVLDHFVINDNLGIQKRGNPRYHSESSKKFYSELYDSVSSYIDRSKSELFTDFTVLDPLLYENVK